MTLRDVWRRMRIIAIHFALLCLPSLARHAPPVRRYDACRPAPYQQPRVCYLCFPPAAPCTDNIALYPRIFPHDVPSFPPFAANPQTARQSQYSPSLEHLRQTSLHTERSRATPSSALRHSTVDDNRGGRAVSVAGSGGEGVGRRDDCWFGHC